MTARAEIQPLLRADAPSRGRAVSMPRAEAPAPAASRDLAFWLLQAWLLLTVTSVDEHYPALDAFQPRLLLSILAAVAAGVVGWQRHVARGGGPLLYARPSGWIAALGITAIFSGIWAYDTSLARLALVETAMSMLAFVLVVACIRTARHVRITMLTLALGSLAFVLLSLWEWFGGRHDFTMNVMRMMGAGWRYADPNSFGASIVFALPLVVWAGAHGRSRFVALCAFLYGALVVYCVFKTSSRSAMVLLGLASLICVAILPRARWRIAALMLLAIGVVVMAATLSPSQRKRLASIVTSETYEREESTRGRIEGYTAAWHVLHDRPLLGVGPGNWSVYRLRRVDGSKLMPHSLAGILIGTRGIAGTLAFLGFLGASLGLAWRELRRRARSRRSEDLSLRALVFALAGIFGLLLVSGLGAHNLDRPTWFLAAGLLVAIAGCTPTDPVAEDAR